jgi:hypothetical protein
LEKENELICENCKGRNFGSFIHYGSWTLKCLDCKASGLVTSFLAVSSNLAGDFEAIEVDEDLNSKARIFKGNIKEGIEKIKASAQEGKIIQLKRVVVAFTMEVEARNLFIQQTQTLMMSRGFNLVQNENNSFDYHRKTNTGSNKIQILPSFYGGKSCLGLSFFIRLDEVNAITNPYLNVIPSAYDHNPTFGLSLSHFNIAEESLILQTTQDITNVVNLLIKLLHEEIFIFFEKFSILNELDSEFNRENRPANLFIHDAFNLPVIGSAIAALNKNPRFGYWENYYRDKLKSTTRQRQEKYESLIKYLKEKYCTTDK